MGRPSEPEDGLGLAGHIAAGRTTAVAAMEAAVARAGEAERFGAVRMLAAGLGLEQAAAIDPRRGTDGADPAAAAFLGVPFLMKDLGATTRGLPTVCGSRGIPPVPATTDSDLAARFRAAGLVAFGTTTVPEFGLALASEPAIGPIARNPLDPSRTPGGSSGGAAAAVAAGIVALAHATDAGGSIRVPAACCGLVGLKPSRGAIPGGPGFANHVGGLASELVVSRSLRDTAAALDACAGRARGPYPDPDLGGPVLPRLDRAPQGLRIGLCVDAGDAFSIAAANADAVRHAGGVLQALGHACVAIPSGRLTGIAATALSVFDRVISANLARNLGDGPAAVEPLTAAIAARGRALSARDLQAAEIAGVQVAHALWRLFDTVDVLITPMLAGPPPPLGAFPFDHADVDAHWRRMAALAPFAMLANVAGTPALSLPHGTSGDLPVSVQLVGPMGSDGLLLRVGRQLQAALPWTFRTAIAGWPA